MLYYSKPVSLVLRSCPRYNTISWWPPTSSNSTDVNRETKLKGNNKKCFRKQICFIQLFVLPNRNISCLGICFKIWHGKFKYKAKIINQFLFYWNRDLQKGNDNIKHYVWYKYRTKYFTLLGQRNWEFDWPLRIVKIICTVLGFQLHFKS